MRRCRNGRQNTARTFYCEQVRAVALCESHENTTEPAACITRGLRFTVGADGCAERSVGPGCPHVDDSVVNE
jgi:hypothetical protein